MIVQAWCSQDQIDLGLGKPASCVASKTLAGTFPAVTGVPVKNKEKKKRFENECDDDYKTSHLRYE